MNSVHIRTMRVIHRRKDAGGHGLPEAAAAEWRRQGLYIDTCLRELCILGDDETRPEEFRDCEMYAGPQAYSFLLQTVTGLNSSVPGETNIAGQFRCAWKRWRKTAPGAQQWRINPLMQQLFADNKDIRNQYLQHIGGNSYGSLLRKLVKPSRGERVLFVGTGRFAQSLVPYFEQCETALWNRRLHPGMDTPAAHHVFAPEAAAEAARWAQTLVLTTPPTAAHDKGWNQLARDESINRIAHLGLRRADPGPWVNVAEPAVNPRQIWTLDDVFDLQRHQSATRRLRVLRARQACDRLAAEALDQQATVSLVATPAGA